MADPRYSDAIVKIDLATGRVVGAYDLTDLHKPRIRGEDCLNGIALEPALEPDAGVGAGGGSGGSGDVVYATGKKWRAAYRIRLGA